MENKDMDRQRVTTAWDVEEWLKLAKESANQNQYVPQSHKWIFDPYTQQWIYAPIVPIV